MAFTQVASLIYIEGSFELLTHPPVPENGTKVLYETLVKERIAKATELMTAPWLGDGEKKLGMI